MPILTLRCIFYKDRWGDCMSKVSDAVFNRLMSNLDSDKSMRWVKGFKTSVLNWAEMRGYTGVNRILLQFGSGEYITFNQLKTYNEKNGTDFRINRGSITYPVVFYSKKEREVTHDWVSQHPNMRQYVAVNPDTEKLLYSFTTSRYYRVFDISDIKASNGDTLRCRIGNELKITNSNVKTLLGNYVETEGIKVTVSHALYCCMYNSDDAVLMPPSNAFEHENEVYYSLAHELIHSTGISTRLNRWVFYDRDKKSRALEELVAECGALLLMGECGLNSEIKNSDSYLLSWAKTLRGLNEHRLKNNADAVTTSEILRAFSQADEAFQYICSFSSGYDNAI